MARGDSPTHTQSSQTLLIVDDERSLRFSIGEWARDAGFRALEASGGREALDLVQQNPVDAVLLDLRLGDEDGLDVLKRLRALQPELPVIMLTGHGTIEHAVEATKLGAWHFMVKPPDLEQLEVTVRRAIEHGRLRREIEHYREGQRAGREIVGDSPGLKRALQRLDRAAKGSATTVLLKGETGSGKELMARRLHEASPRAAGPFIDLNCSAIPEQLLESMLFGHERGAFTDARQFKKGLFDLADGGTLFLDEIGEMSPQLQAKLLRVLELKTYRRVGGHEDISVDVRVIAATHRDLQKLVGEGRFREDLFYRLNVVSVEMPPLRERLDDLEPLAGHFLRQFCADFALPPVRLHPDVLLAFRQYPWPGNVRELRNVIEHVLLVELEGDVVQLEHLPPEIRSHAPGVAGAIHTTPFPPDVVVPMAEVEKMAIEHALQVCGNNKTRAAQKLGISRQTLRTKLKEFQMEDDAGSDGED